MFDLEEYIDTNCHVIGRVSGGERVLQECPSCGGRGRFYVNVISGKFNCYKCPFGGHTPDRFIALVEGITEWEARRMMKEKIRFTRPKREVAKLFQPGARLESPGLPDEYIPCFDKAKGKWNGIPSYLADRGVKKKAVAAHKLGWCKVGKFKDRVVFPIITGDLISFQARATWHVGEYEPKYDSPAGAPHSMMLMGYQLIKPGNELWVVEGPMDVIGCYQAGLPAVGLIGKSMSEAQANLIAAAKPSAVHFMLDAEAERSAIRTATDSHLTHLVTLDRVRLRGGDPGDLKPKVLAAQARRFLPMRRSSLVAALASSSIFSRK